jgi:hypothetical protein
MVTKEMAELVRKSWHDVLDERTPFRGRLVHDTEGYAPLPILSRSDQSHCSTFFPIVFFWCFAFVLAVSVRFQRITPHAVAVEVTRVSSANSRCGTSKNIQIQTPALHRPRTGARTSTSSCPPLPAQGKDKDNNQKENHKERDSSANTVQSSLPAPVTAPVPAVAPTIGAASAGPSDDVSHTPPYGAAESKQSGAALYRSKQVVFFDFFFRHWFAVDPAIELVFSDVRSQVSVMTTRMISFLLKYADTLNDPNTLTFVRRIALAHRNNHVQAAWYEEGGGGGGGVGVLKVQPNITVF